jgi:hypothetical protein
VSWFLVIAILWLLAAAFVVLFFMGADDRRDK